MGHHIARRFINLTFAFLLAVFSVNLSGVLTIASAHAAAAPSNNGTLKVHELGTPFGTESNDPQVCAFNFEGFSFDKNQSGYIVVETQPGGVSSLAPSTLPFGPTNNSGYAITANINDGGAYSLANGDYKATLYGKQTGNPSLPNLNDEKAKSKVFHVDCNYATPTPPTQVDQCGTSNDKYTIPSTAGVIYKINGATKTAGTYSGSGTVAITAVASNQNYILQGTTNWTFTFSSTACVITVTATAPSKFSDSCGTSNDKYVIPSTTGVDYYINGVPTAAGTYATNGAASVTITAVAKTGYVLQGSTSWTLSFDTTACPIQVTPTTPTKDVDLCGTLNDKFTIPTKTGVIYYVNGITKDPGQYNGTGMVTVTAVAASGYVLQGTSSWIFVFTNLACPIVVTPTAPTSNDRCAADDDTYTIPSTTGVTYWVKVGLGYVPASAGTHSAFAGVTIKATANNGYVLIGQSDWTLNFSLLPCVVQATAPTATDKCGTQDDIFTIPTAQHVTYKKLVGFFLFIFPIYQTVTAGDHSGSGTVIIKAFADDDYTLTGTDTWALPFTNTACVISVIPSEPQFFDNCGELGNHYTIPTKDGVSYYNGQTLLSAGNHYGNGSVTITAVANQGFAFLANATTQWSHTFNYSVCPAPHIVASALCDRDGVTVTLENDGNADGNVLVDGLADPFVTVPANSSVQVVVPFDPLTFKVNVLVGNSDESTLLDEPLDCTPGRGGIDQPTQPTTPTAPTVTLTKAALPKGIELPDTGANPLQQLITVIAAGIVAYGTTFYLINRRDLFKK